MKINHYSRIPPFTRSSAYQTSVPWKHIERTLQSYSEGCDNFLLDPDFQRGHVWTVEKQIAYVEFILRGGKSSRDILFNHPGWMKKWKGDMTLVDGKQRLQAARDFLANKFPVFGTYHDDFEDKFPVTSVSFMFHVNDLGSRAEILQWYLDLNSGGVVHTEEELNKVRALLALEKKQ